MARLVWPPWEWAISGRTAQGACCHWPVSRRAYQLEASRALLRLDGQYGTGAVLADVAGFAFVTRGKEYSVLDHPLVQARLHLPPDQVQQREDEPDGAQPLRLS